jgi:hypothetical protein
MQPSEAVSLTREVCNSSARGNLCVDKIIMTPIDEVSGFAASYGNPGTRFFK